MRKSFYNRRVMQGVYRETPDYPSNMSGGCSTAKRESQQYTGDVVLGIATMHKSNLVPVTKGSNTNPKLHKGGIE